MLGGGKTYLESGAAEPAVFDAQTASVLLDNAMGGGEPQPRTIAVRLGREERFENLRPERVRNPRPRVVNSKDQILPILRE